jgi:hypothetical protein
LQDHAEEGCPSTHNTIDRDNDRWFKCRGVGPFSKVIIPSNERLLLSDDYLNNRSRLRPALLESSFASSVSSLSELAALKRCSTTAMYSSLLSVPS